MGIKRHCFRFKKRIGVYRCAKYIKVRSKAKRRGGRRRSR